MVPETCEPTCTVVTALMVPVASTTVRMSPRSIFSVKYWVESRAVSILAAMATAATATIMSAIQIFFAFFTVPGLFGLIIFDQMS